jgi:hypothetical protein
LEASAVEGDVAAGKDELHAVREGLDAAAEGPPATSDDTVAAEGLPTAVGIISATFDKARLADLATLLVCGSPDFADNTNEIFGSAPAVFNITVLVAA